MQFISKPYASWQGATKMTEMKGKICIVTGSNSGIGRETALALAKMGATVVMVVRNRERGEKARLEIIGESGNDATCVMICDVSSTDSVRRFAKEFRDAYDRLDVLINNAGVFTGKRQVTVDGFERTLAVNYLGPFLLTCELLPLLKSSAPSRIINVGSGMASSGKIAFDDLQYENKYSGMKAYANSKLMLTMYTYELAGRLEGSGVTANVVEPGFVATNLGRNSGSLLLSLGFKMMRPIQVSARKGAETSVYLASAPDVEGVTGKCFAKLQETRTSQLSYDQEMQGRLWNVTVELLGLPRGTIRYLDQLHPRDEENPK
jgi:NAD(P)-dependent dehydrogenase (short-subunit alcohol dehydrogenase family)